MQFFNQDWKNCYEELVSWYPIFYRDVREMKAILQAQGSLADNIQAGIEQVLSNTFIDTADEMTVKRMETFLGIVPQSTKTLEERRQFVKVSFIGIGKVSASVLASMICSYTESDVVITLEPFDEDGNNCLFVSLPYSKGALYEKDIEEILEKMIPAHMIHHIRLISDLSGDLYPISLLYPSQDIYPK